MFGDGVGPAQDSSRDSFATEFALFDREKYLGNPG